MVDCSLWVGAVEVVQEVLQGCHHQFQEVQFEDLVLPLRLPCVCDEYGQSNL